MLFLYWWRELLLLGIMGSRAWRITTPFRRTIPSRYLSNGRDYLNSFDLVIDQIRNHGEMEMLGSCVAGALWEGDVVLLKGDLGAGKSTFVRGLIRNLCQDDSLLVTSPTYLLDNTYQMFCEADGKEKMVSIHHMDLYRLPKGCDLSFLSIPKVFDNSLCLIEWPERLGKYKPNDFISIEFRIDDISEFRSASFSFNGRKFVDRKVDIEHSLRSYSPRGSI